MNNKYQKWLDEKNEHLDHIKKLKAQVNKNQKGKELKDSLSTLKTREQSINKLFKMKKELDGINSPQEELKLEQQKLKLKKLKDELKERK